MMLSEAGEVRRFLREKPEAPAGSVRTVPDPGEDDGGGAVLACAFCQRPVTTTAARIEVDGAHEHSFTNPHGFRFTIGCFAQAVGCRVSGEPSTFWTWFPGFSWQIESCGRCGEHLGWLFHSADGEFHGLILDRLVSLDEDA